MLLTGWRGVAALVAIGSCAVDLAATGTEDVTALPLASVQARSTVMARDHGLVTMAVSFSGSPTGACLGPSSFTSIPSKIGMPSPAGITMYCGSAEGCANTMPSTCG